MRVIKVDHDARRSKQLTVGGRLRNGMREKPVGHPGLVEVDCIDVKLGGAQAVDVKREVKASASFV